jgi:hypothetical protein
VNDRRAPKIFVETAGKFACRPGLYDLPHPSKGWLGTHIDLWGYESGLPAAIEQLIGGPDVDGDVWLRNLVPFVAGLFARGPDQNRGENNEARVRAFQEMLAPTMVSEWTVLHYPADVVTSDRGLAALKTPVGTGLAVPLDRRAVLLLTRQVRRTVLSWRGSRWRTVVRHHAVGSDEVAVLRDALAQFALNAIVGPTAPSVAVDRALLGAANKEWPGVIVNPYECDLVCHLYDYFRIASAMGAARPDAQSAADTIDFATLPSWRTPIAVEMGFPERTRGGVAVHEDSIELNLVLGLELRAKRRAVGDFRQGAFAIAPVDRVRRGPVPLGEMCRDSADGRAGRTHFLNSETGTRIAVDLHALETASGW